MMVIVCDEMKKLMELLDKKGIKYHDASEEFEKDRFICRIHADDGSFSCINGFGTYGGYIFNPKENEGLLELMLYGHNPVGYLKAESAIYLIEKVRKIDVSCWKSEGIK